MGPCRRAKRKPQSRWRDELINDLKQRKLRNWSEIVKDIKAWSDLVQKIYPCGVVVTEEEDYIM